MAMDEAALGGRTPPPLLQAAWAITRSVGRWWAWTGAAVLSEHPVELHPDEEKRLHGTDGPAAVYKDGWRVFAWNGYAMPEQWIRDRASVPARDLKNCPASFRKHAASAGSKQPKAQGPKKKSELLSRELPRDGTTRSAMRRDHAGGRLPRFDRYVSGEYRHVWQGLLEAGEAVREDAIAPDALAVAYETMKRVSHHMRLLIERLTTIGYRFNTNPPHRPPGKKTWKQLQHLERLARPVPLAPDDLHKENISCGDPYVIAIPDGRADALVLNERHHLLFVDYLRLCCRLGGFSGYDGVDRGVPAELEQLRAELVEF
jgi:hypothetical protein